MITALVPTAISLNQHNIESADGSFSTAEALAIGGSRRHYAAREGRIRRDRRKACAGRSKPYTLA